MVTIPTTEWYLVLFLAITLVTIFLARQIAVPYTLGLVLVGLLLGISGLLPSIHLTPTVVLFVFLPALLFEGAWSLRWDLIKANWRAIFFLAGPGLLFSLGIIAVILHFLEHLDVATALLLAAILSPTDPVAVLGLFRRLHINEQLSSIIEGESLFNDGVAGSLYQTFLALVLLSMSGGSSGALQLWGQGILLFVLEAGGAVLLGLACGWLVCRFLRRIDEPLIETTTTLITAYGVYLLADLVHVSALIAVIVAAIMVGNYGRSRGISESSRAVIDDFWSVVAFLANAVLFLLVGIQLNPLALPSLAGGYQSAIIIAIVAVCVVLLARLVMVLLLGLFPRMLFPGYTGGLRALQPLARSFRLIIFWSGMRGALSLALVLALPQDIPNRGVLLVSTYAVIFFTLIIQGISLRWVIRRLPLVRSVTPMLIDEDESEDDGNGEDGDDTDTPIAIVPEPLPDAERHP